MSQLFINNFQTQFITSAKAAPTTGNPASELDYGIIRVSDGAAGVLLNPGASNWYVLTAFKRTGTAEGSHEIMRVTSVDNSVVGECRLTVLRGQEGTNPAAYSPGDLVELRLTAGAMGEFAQASDPRLADSRSPSGPAGGVLSGAYPNPDFAQAMATAVDLATKVDKVNGKGLSANDFDNASVTKLSGIAEQASKNATDAQLRDRATHTGAQAIGTVTGLQAALDSKVPAAAGKGLSTEDYSTAEKNKLAGVAAGATANATDAQLRDRATHTGAQAVSTVTGLQAALDAKQPNLVSGTNIKTVNGASIVGAGNVVLTADDPNAVKLTGAQSVSGLKTYNNGVGFGMNPVASATDFSKQISLHGSTYGLSITPNNLNYVADTSANHTFVVGSGVVATINSTGLGMSGDITTAGRVSGSGGLYAAGGGADPIVQGAYLGWNRFAGGGRVDFMCHGGGGSGGFQFWTRNVGASPLTSVAVLDSSGNFSAFGNITAYSDPRLKKDWADLPSDFIERLAEVTHGTYTRIDSGERHVGVDGSALKGLMPEAVPEDKDGLLSVAYGNAALVAAIRLAEKVTALEARLRVLEAQK